MGWRKYAAGAAGFTLGGIVANVPGAFAGGYYAYKKAEADENSSPKRMKRAYPSPPRTPSRKKARLTIKYSRPKSARRPNFKKTLKKKVKVARKTAFTGMSTVVGMGRFPKSSKKNYESLCLKYGYGVTNEVYGRVEDPNCVYISHNTYHVLSIVRAITGALLRKLFKKSGIDVVNNKSGINFAQQTTGGKVDGRLQFQTYNQLTGFYSNVVMDLTDLMNFDDIVTAWSDNGFPNRLGAYLYAYILNNSDDELRSVTLLTKDNSIAINDYRPLSHIVVPNEYISIYVTSEMKIQNRTKAQQAADDFSADRVDNQPLVGRMFKFRHADPRLKELAFRNDAGQALDVVFNRQALAGVTLTRATEVSYSTFQEPPVKAHFANCSSAQKIHLLPGDMKTSKISHVYKGMFINLMKKFRAERVQQGSGSFFDAYLTGIPGKNQMFALEEELRTDSTNLITVNYECEFKIGAIVKTKKKATAFTSLLTSETHSNTPGE